MPGMDEIYQTYARTVYGFLMARTGNEDLAEELTQETFIQAIRTIDRYDGSCRLSTWLCAIARNCLLTYRRKHPEASEIQEDSGTGASAETSVLDGRSRLDLIRALHTLPDPGREVMYLRVFGGLSFAEIGEVHGKSENWARVTFFRAKEKLRKEKKDDEASL